MKEDLTLKKLDKTLDELSDVMKSIKKNNLEMEKITKAAKKQMEMSTSAQGVSKNTSELVRGEFKLVARNAILPQRALKKLNDLYREVGIVFKNENIEENNAVMTFGPKVEKSILLDAEIGFLNCVVHKKSKNQE